jgi:hypothetical protein
MTLKCNIGFGFQPVQFTANYKVYETHTKLIKLNIDGENRKKTGKVGVQFAHLLLLKISIEKSQQFF